MHKDENIERCRKRLDLLIEEYHNFIERFKFKNNSIELNLMDLVDVVNNYFKTSDQVRNEFEIPDYTHSHKVAAFTAYWISKIKPIKLNEMEYKKEEHTAKEIHRAIYLNEYFAIMLAYGRMQEYYDSANLPKKIEIEKSVFDHLVYCLRYKNPTVEGLAIIFYLIENGGRQIQTMINEPETKAAGLINNNDPKMT